MRGWFIKNKSSNFTPNYEGSDGYEDIYKSHGRKVLGVRIQKGVSSPDTSVIYTDDLQGQSAGSYMNYSSNFLVGNTTPSLYKTCGLQPVAIRNGKVFGYLDYGNLSYWQKSIDGSADGWIGVSRYTKWGAERYNSNPEDLHPPLSLIDMWTKEFDIMVEIKHCWLSITQNASYIYIRLANYKVDSTFSDDAFKSSGVTHQTIYVGMFQASLDVNNKLRSIDGVAPWTNTGGNYSSGWGYASKNSESMSMVNFDIWSLMVAMSIIDTKSTGVVSKMGNSVCGSTLPTYKTGDSLKISTKRGIVFNQHAQMSWGTNTVSTTPSMVLGFECLYGGLGNYISDLTWAWLGGSPEWQRGVLRPPNDLYSPPPVSISTLPNNMSSGYISSIRGESPFTFTPSGLNGSTNGYYTGSLDFSRVSADSIIKNVSFGTGKLLVEGAPYSQFSTTVHNTFEGDSTPRLCMYSMERSKSNAPYPSPS